MGTGALRQAEGGCPRCPGFPVSEAGGKAVALQPSRGRSLGVTGEMAVCPAFFPGANPSGPVLWTGMG